MFVLGFCLDEPGTGGTVLFRRHRCWGGGAALYLYRLIQLFSQNVLKRHFLHISFLILFIFKVSQYGRVGSSFFLELLGRRPFFYGLGSGGGGTVIIIIIILLLFLFVPPPRR